MHDLRSSLIRGESRDPIARKQAGAPKRLASDGSLSGIKIRRQEARRSDQRHEPRHVQVIDNAVIRQQRRTLEVPVLNLSSRGAMVECDLRPRIGARLMIRFADCNETACSVRWVRDGRIGIEFDKETVMIGANDVQRPIVGGRRAGEHPPIALRKQRAPRQASMLRAQLHTRNGTMAVKLRNISSSGAMLQATEDLPEQFEVVLEIPRAPAIPGRVRWCLNKQIGIHFDEELDLDSLLRAPEEIHEQPDYLKPDYLRSELDADSPWASKRSGLTIRDL